MKFLIVLGLLSSLAFAQTHTKKPAVSSPAKKTTAKTMPKHPALQTKKEEDCDEKAKKPIEIKPQSISLSGGNTGCSLE